MAVDARMRLESASKIWTAVLVLQLAEQGRLNPARVLARVKDPGFHAELVRLASHLQADPTIRFPPTVWIRLAATQPLYFPPGTGCWARSRPPACGRATSGQLRTRPAAVAAPMGTAAPGEGYKTNVWVSSDGRRVVVLLLNGRMADQATGDRRAAQALDELYCSA